jgi:hypothetical protein
VVSIMNETVARMEFQGWRAVEAIPGDDRLARSTEVEYKNPT